MDFQTFHKYNRLVRQGKASSLRCDACKSEVVTRLGPLDSVVLWCYGCNSYTTPGLNTCDRVRAVVEEHFMEDDYDINQ